MAIADRALRAFESELVRLLSFSYTVMRSFDSKGSPRSRIRIWMRNNSNVVVTNLRGSIGPGEAVAFPYTTFQVERMAPGSELEVARIEAVLLSSGPERRLEGLATVNVSGAVDLSTFRFKDTARSATYVAARIPVEGDEASFAIERTAAPRPNAIPVSDYDGEDLSAEKRSA